MLVHCVSYMNSHDNAEYFLECYVSSVSEKNEYSMENASDENDYRPISVISTVARVFLLTKLKYFGFDCNAVTRICLILYSSVLLDTVVCIRHHIRTPFILNVH